MFQCVADTLIYKINDLQT